MMSRKDAFIMKKPEYIRPELEIYEIGTVDVITTSIGNIQPGANETPFIPKQH